jgi:hypothetical protein
MLIGFISILSGGIISYNKSKGKKTDLDFKGVYKIISNNYIFYPVVFMILSFGIVFVLFHDANGLYIFIAALYIVIFQIILINSLKIYGQYSDCVHKINMLHEIKINMIKEELKDIKYNMLYNNIVFDEKRELLNEKYLNKK